MDAYIPMITKRCVCKIFLQDIIYIMKKQRKILIVTEKGPFEFYGKLDNVCGYLDSRFYFCLQHMIINLDKIERLEHQDVYFSNGEMVGLGRDNYVRTKQYYCAYLKHLL